MNDIEQANHYLDSGNGEQALPIFKKLAGAGRVDAMSSIGHTYLHGIAGIEQDYDLAFEWFTTAAKNGYPQAMYHLGLCNAKGYGTPIDPAASAEWYRRSAERGDEDAMFQLGECKGS